MTACSELLCLCLCVWGALKRALIAAVCVCPLGGVDLRGSDPHGCKCRHRLGIVVAAVLFVVAAAATAAAAVVQQQ